MIPLSSRYLAILEARKATLPIALRLSEVLCASRAVQRETVAATKNDMIFGQARVLREQLIVRIARTIDLVRCLPQTRDDPDLQAVMAAYARWFTHACDLVVADSARSHAAFLTGLDGLQRPPGQEVLQRLSAVGRRHSGDAADASAALLHDALQVLCRRRVTWQLLVANHVSVAGGQSQGILRDDLRPMAILQDVARGVGAQAREALGTDVGFVFSGLEDATMTHVPANLQYIFAEILKNAARATIVHHHKSASASGTGVDPLRPLPPVAVSVNQAGESVVVKVADAGGGIPKSHAQSVWHFGFTTAAQQHHPPAGASSSGPTTSTPNEVVQFPLAGYGLGLPLSKLYAEQFGGSLQLLSTDRGCSVVFSHPVSGVEVFRKLPISSCGGPSS